MKTTSLPEKRANLKKGNLTLPFASLIPEDRRSAIPLGAQGKMIKISCKGIAEALLEAEEEQKRIYKANYNDKTLEQSHPADLTYEGGNCYSLSTTTS